jgi:hypothetical protein
VEQATTLGFTVGSSFGGVTAVTWDERVIRVAVGEPLERVVALATMVGELRAAATRTAAEPPTPPPHPQHARPAEHADVRVPEQAEQTRSSTPTADHSGNIPPQRCVVRSCPAGPDTPELPSDHPLYDELLASLGWEDPLLTVPETWPSGPVRQEPALTGQPQQSTADSGAGEQEVAGQQQRVAVKQRPAPPTAKPVPTDTPEFDRLVAALGWEDIDFPPLPEVVAPREAEQAQAPNTPKPDATASQPPPSPVRADADRVEPVPAPPTPTPGRASRSGAPGRSGTHAVTREPAARGPFARALHTFGLGRGGRR